MNLRYTLIILFSVLIWLLNVGNSTGAGSNNFNCNNCHSGSTSTTTIDSIVLRELTSEKIIKYSPNKTYIVTLYGQNSASLPRFGFQMTHNNKGAFSSPSADCQVSGSIWEHKQKISGTSGKFQISTRWTAPSSGSGTVNFNAYLNAVNNNNGTDGDKPSNMFTYTVDELKSEDSASVEITITAGSNPAKAPEMIRFKAIPNNGGTTPEYQWRVNSTNIGTRTTEDVYTTSTLNNGDTVYCWMYSSKAGALPNPAISNKIKRVIFNTSSISTDIQSKIELVSLSSNKFKLNGIENSKGRLAVYNTTGKLIFNTNELDKILDFQHFEKGVYLIHFDIEGSQRIEKIIIQ